MKSSNRITGFFGGAWAEIKKITWPTKQETVMYTVAVLFICALVAIILGLFDMLYLHLLEKFVF